MHWASLPDRLQIAWKQAVFQAQSDTIYASASISNKNACFTCSKGKHNKIIELLLRRLAGGRELTDL